MSQITILFCQKLMLQGYYDLHLTLLYIGRLCLQYSVSLNVDTERLSEGSSTLLVWPSIIRTWNLFNCFNQCGCHHHLEWIITLHWRVQQDPPCSVGLSLIPTLPGRGHLINVPGTNSSHWVRKGLGWLPCSQYQNKALLTLLGGEFVWWIQL